MHPIPFAHPVEPAQRERIRHTLAQIERRYEVQILLACESGSRAWGFASPDSDYDVRFIYVHRLPWYLTVQSGRDVIELPIDDVLDVSGWDLRKTLGLLQASNPTLHEWLRSPILYQCDTAAHVQLATLAQTHFSPERAWHHYISMARNNYRAYLRGDQVRLKKYLYALRPLLAARWVAQRGTAPPMAFSELVSTQLDAHDDTVLRADIQRLLEWKMQASEAAHSAPWPALSAFIESELERKPQLPARTPVSAADIAALDAFLYRRVSGEA